MYYLELCYNTFFHLPIYLFNHLYQYEIMNVYLFFGFIMQNLHFVVQTVAALGTKSSFMLSLVPF